MCISAAARNNPVRGPLNAWFFTLFDGYINSLVAEYKSRLFASLPDTVVELGPGIGANFRYMRSGTAVTAIEPNPHMHNGLRRRAEAYGIELSICASGAEAIDLPDHCVEAVICTLVLCTVDDPRRVLQETLRVLKPGGRFVFLEHVAAPRGGWRRGLQNALHRPWRYCFEGCHTNRDTAHLIRTAGFKSVALECYEMRGPFIPVNTQIAGTAIA